MLKLNEPWIERPRFDKFSFLLMDAVAAGERPKYSVANAIQAPLGYVDLMQKCWAQAPIDRPDFGAVLYQLQNMHRDALANALANATSESTSDEHMMDTVPLPRQQPMQLAVDGFDLGTL